MNIVKKALRKVKGAFIQEEIEILPDKAEFSEIPRGGW